MEKNIVDLPDLDQKIYRIFKLETFIKILTNKKLRLVRPKEWDDPFEDIFYKSNLVNNHGEVISQIYERDRLYGQCWTLRYESDALWRIYSDKDLLDGIKVQTTVRKLFSCFYNSLIEYQDKRFFIGRIQYLTIDQIKEKLEDEKYVHNIQFDSTNLEGAKTLLIKRKEFDHEEEVRLIYFEHQRHEIGKYPSYYEFNFDPADIFEAFELDPRLDADSFEELRAGLAKYYHGKISRSRLYENPTITPRINIGPKSLRELQNSIVK
ncbi:MAG: DUF2971 domain-containing protein [Imperialibacter sp.]|uniref:DUF2971 domain-containing protein n=1 Tax=Imperialibacter sp. TaxID=2038411 RepID=UPI003A8BE044